MITLILILAFIRLAYYAVELKEENDDLKSSLKWAEANYEFAYNMWRDELLKRLGGK